VGRPQEPAFALGQSPLTAQDRHLHWYFSNAIPGVNSPHRLGGMDECTRLRMCDCFLLLMHCSL
jgi:hypothetical protein